jgi:hypothetical protein
MTGMICSGARRDDITGIVAMARSSRLFCFRPATNPAIDHMPARTRRDRSI